MGMLAQDSLAPESPLAGGLAFDLGFVLDLADELGDARPVGVVGEMGPTRELRELQSLGGSGSFGVDLAAALAIKVGA